MTKKKKTEEASWPKIAVAQKRLVESGVVFLEGDTVHEGIVPYDRIIFLLAKEWVRPVGGYDSLPEPFFTDVMEMRD